MSLKLMHIWLSIQSSPGPAMAGLGHLNLTAAGAMELPKQEMKHESPRRGMEMDEIWLWVKKEIKEELEKDMMSANFESDILMQGVMMKEEIEVDAKRTQACWNLQVAKRRRLTDGDMQKIMRAEAAEDPRCPSSVKKELADGVNVKKEPFACDMQEAVNHKDRSSRILSGRPRCNNFAEEWNKKAWTFRTNRELGVPMPFCRIAATSHSLQDHFFVVIQCGECLRFSEVFTC